MDALYVICRTVEIDDAQARGFVLMKAEESGETAAWPIVITRKGNNFYGFENACPHEGTRLDLQPGAFMDDEGNFIECGRHHAQFDIDTGECFIGPCQGSRLTPIKLVIDEGDVCVAGVMLADE